jgi:hypothetical protein
MPIMMMMMMTTTMTTTAIKFVLYLYAGLTVMAINKSDTNARRQQNQHQSRQEEKQITVNFTN